MNEDELAELIEETDATIEEYKKQNENKEVKQYSNEDITQYRSLLIEMWDISSDEEKAEFIQMAIKNIFIEYVLGKMMIKETSFSQNKGYRVLLIFYGSMRN